MANNILDRIDLLSEMSRVQVPWVKVTIGDCYTFGVYDKNTRALISDEKGIYLKAFNVDYPNYIKSLKITKINGQINRYTLGISYPITQFDDPNFFEKVFSKACPYNSVGYDECHVYINEVPIATLLEEAKHSLISRVQNAYLETINPDSMTVREYIQIHREMEKSEKLQYEAMKYIRMVFSHASVLERSNIDLDKMSARDYIDFVTKAPLLADDQEEWNKKLDEIKTKYGKETED
jgi:hypothetical protein